MSSATDSRSRSRATAATCAAVSRGRPDRPTHSVIAWCTGTGRQPVARVKRPAPPVFAAAASMPDGLPWKIVSASSTAASTASSPGGRAPAAAAARATATASAAELPRPARDGTLRVGVEVERAARSSRRTIAASAPPDRAVVAGRRLEAPGRHAQAPAARRAPSP